MVKFGMIQIISAQTKLSPLHTRLSLSSAQFLKQQLLNQKKLPDHGEVWKIAPQKRHHLIQSKRPLCRNVTATRLKKLRQSISGVCAYPEGTDFY